MDSKLLVQVAAVVLVLTVGIMGPIAWRLAYWKKLKLNLPDQALDRYSGDVRNYGLHPFDPRNAVFWMGFVPVFVDAFIVWRHPELKDHSVFRKAH